MWKNKSLAFVLSSHVRFPYIRYTVISTIQYTLYRPYIYYTDLIHILQYTSVYFSVHISYSGSIPGWGHCCVLGQKRLPVTFTVPLSPASQEYNWVSANWWGKPASQLRMCGLQWTSIPSKGVEILQTASYATENEMRSGSYHWSICLQGFLYLL